MEFSFSEIQPKQLGFDIHAVQITNFSSNFHKIVATKHNVKILFTKFTFLFTI